MKKTIILCLLTIISSSSLNAQIRPADTTTFTTSPVGTVFYQGYSPGAISNLEGWDINVSMYLFSTTANLGQDSALSVKQYSSNAIAFGDTSTKTHLFGSSGATSTTPNLPMYIRLKPNDGSSFRFKSLYYGFFGTKSLFLNSINISGYKNGVAVPSASLTLPFRTSGPLYSFSITPNSTRDSAFSNIDEIVIAINGAALTLNSTSMGGFLLGQIIIENPVIYNSAPVFTGAGVRTLTVCQNSVNNSLQNNLQVSDADNGQTETYAITNGPTNGTITTGGTVTSNGGIVSPSGWSYTPNNGYSGIDSFTIRVSDGQGAIVYNTVMVTVKSASTSITNFNIVSAQLPYSWNGLTFNGAGTQTAHLTNAVGCDSAATLKLSTLSTTNKAYCQSELPTTWNGLTIAAAGTYTVHLTNAAGGDSAATLVATLKAGPLATVNYLTGVNVTSMGMCNIGDSIQVANYTAPGGVWTSSNPGVASVAPTASYNRVAKVKAIGVGTVTISYGGITSSGGCPSTISMQVTVMPINTPTVIIGSGTACLNTATSFSNATSDGIWSASRGTITTNGDYTPASVGTGVITYTLSNVAGCSKSVSKSVTINTQPAIPSINFATGTTGITGTGGYCTNRTFTLVGTPAGGVWSKTGVINITSGGVVTTTSLTGAASATYTVTNAAGCSNSRTISTAIVACSPRGISTQSAMSNEQLVIYPNPAHDIINLNVRTLVGKGSIVLTDYTANNLNNNH